MWRQYIFKWLIGSLEKKWVTFRDRIYDYRSILDVGTNLTDSVVQVLFFTELSEMISIWMDYADFTAKWLYYVYT